MITLMDLHQFGCSLRRASAGLYLAAIVSHYDENESDAELYLKQSIHLAYAAVRVLTAVATGDA